MSALAQQFLANWGARLIEGAMVLTLVSGVWGARKNRDVFRAGLGLTAGVVLVSVAGYFLDSTGLRVVHDLFLLGFFMLTAWVAVRQMLFSGRVDGNAIVGAICVYLLLGMIWAMLYLLVGLAAPGSFKGLAAEAANLPELIYFSFISLTTMGYGDITPVLPLARFFAFMEGVVGQFYVAILVASLVGVRVSGWQQK